MPAQTTTAGTLCQPISIYTRDQALADGGLIDMQKGGVAEVTRQHFGDCPVYFTRSLIALIQQAVDHPRWANDWKGVTHDIFTMAKCYGLSKLSAGSTMRLVVIITGCGRKRNQYLMAAFDGEALTIGLPEDF